jgi:hypothetical protein
MVSTVILLILLVLFSSVITNGSSVWNLNMHGMEKASNGRSACDFISREMTGALLPANRTSGQSLQFIVDPPNVDSSFNSRDSVFWQAPVATDTSMGDIAEVGYFVQWDLSNANNPQASLCRLFVNSSDTANFLIYGYPLKWITTQVLASVASANGTTSPPYQGLLTQNVIGLWVNCLDPYGNAIAKTSTGGFDSRTGYTDSNGTVHAACSLPAAVDLSFVTIDSGTAAHINNSIYTTLLPLVRQATSANNFVTQNQNNASLVLIRSAFRPFTLRIFLRNSS